MVDPGWMVNRSAYDAIELLRALEPYRIFWLEDFLHPENYDGYARVKEAGVKTRLAAGEQEATAWGFHDLITRGQDRRGPARPEPLRRASRRPGRSSGKPSAPAWTYALTRG